MSDSEYCEDEKKYLYNTCSEDEKIDILEPNMRIRVIDLPSLQQKIDHQADIMMRQGSAKEAKKFTKCYEKRLQQKKVQERIHDYAITQMLEDNEKGPCCKSKNW
jgi:hypothetical protein